MAESKMKEAVRFRSRASETLLPKFLAEMVNEDPFELQNQASVIREVALPASTEHKSSYILTKSLAEMVNEDPIRLQNQSCVIREEIVMIREGKHFVYSSFARLPTFSIGLASTADEAPPPAPLRESSVDRKDKSSHRYFQMPELGARVFVGDVGGSDTVTCHLFDEDYQASEFDTITCHLFDEDYQASEFDTITCHLFDEDYQASEFDLDSEYSAVRSLCKDERPGGLSGWLRTQPAEFWRDGVHSEVILSGTEFFVGPRVHDHGAPLVGNLGGMSSRVSGSSSDYKDCTGEKTFPSDVVEQLGDPVPIVHLFGGDSWKSVEGPYLMRFPEGSYLKKPDFMERDYGDFLFDPPHKLCVLQLTRFDDFVILGNRYFDFYLHPAKVVDIVRKNASERADVIAVQLVKRAVKENRSLLPFPITAIVIFLDHKEISLRERKKEKKENIATKDTPISLGISGLKGISQSTILRNYIDTKIGDLKEDEKLTTLKEEEKIFASDMEGKKGIMMEEDHKVKILVGELWPNIPQISTVLLEENELGMKSRAISSNVTSAEVQDDSEASSPAVSLIEDDDFESEDLMVSRHLTKWIIYGDLLERTLLCFFNMEEMQYEFYFEDHESMATIIGLGVPHSKVVLECGSPHVAVVEIPKEDWDVVWAHSNFISPSNSSEGYVSKQERFPDILHRIANIINSDNVVRKANNGGGGRDKGKGKACGNASDRKGKGKAHGHDNLGNSGHPDGGSNEPPDDDDKKERRRKDGNDGQKDQGDGKSSKADCKEVQAVVFLRLLPGGVLENKEKKKEVGDIHEGEGEEEEGDGEEEGEGEGKGSKGVGRDLKAFWKPVWNALTGGENGNVVENQQARTTTEGVENGDGDENLENQIHSQMLFTFTIKDEAGGPLKTIQATIKPITFQFPNNNEENYVQRGRFGWFHERLQVAFGVVSAQVADLDPDSCKVLDSSEAKEVNSEGSSKGKGKTSTNVYKGNAGIKDMTHLHGIIASAEYDRTNASEEKTSEEGQKSWETNKTLTKGGFSVADRTDLNSHQLKYSYTPHFPFNEKEFEVKDKVGRLKMYENPICQLQRVSCEGTWSPVTENLEAYKLEASRELKMTRIYNLDLETGEEKKQKEVWKVEKNLPLCFIQKLEKVVYLNHAMSHLTSSTTGVYRVKQQQDPNDPSTTFLTQAQSREEPIWPSNNPLVDVKQ